MTGIAPGWYPDPADRTTQRYWDGDGWLGEPIPAGVTPPDVPPSPAPPPQPLPPVGTPSPPGATQPQPPGGPTLGPTGLPHVSARMLLVPKPHGLPPAKISARLAARLIDTIVVLLLNVVVNGWLVVQYVHEVAPVFPLILKAALHGNPNDGQIPEFSSRAQNLEIAILVLALVLWFAYEVPSTANNGQTLGKRLLHLKVVGVESLEPLGFRRAWRRWNPLGLAVPLWFCCGFGFLLQALDLMVGFIDQPLHQTIHDKSAGTVVVKVPTDQPKPVDRSPATRPHDHEEPPSTGRDAR